MRKLVIAAVALIFSAGMFAQQPQREQHREFKPEAMATRMADDMKKELSLTDEQYKSVYDLYLKRAEEMKARREKKDNTQQTQQGRREEMRKQQEAMNAELKKILTAEQYTKYEEAIKKMQQRQRQGQGGPRGGQRGQGMGPR